VLYQGDAGDDGSDGVPGANGADGADGMKGQKGEPGSDGTRGMIGPPGITGKTCNIQWDSNLKNTAKFWKLRAQLLCTDVPYLPCTYIGTILYHAKADLLVLIQVLVNALQKIFFQEIYLNRLVQF